MAELAGYLDRWSALPGDRIGVYLSSSRPTVVSVDLLRLGRGSHRAEPGGATFECVDTVTPKSCEVLPLNVDIGSYAEVGGLGRLDLRGGSLALAVQPWAVGGPEQTVLVLDGAGAGADIRVVVTPSGTIALHGGAVVAAANHRLVPRRWVLMHLSWTAAQVSLTVATLEGRSLAELAVAREAHDSPVDRLILAGAPLPGGVVGHHFDGRLERPVLWPRATIDPVAVREAVLSSHDLPLDACACWDFAQQIDTQHLVDIGPLGLHGRLVQGPKRAVRGVRWSGEVFDWRQAPDQYGAIHFHRDDLMDAGWPLLAHVELPASLPSGAYAIRARCEGDHSEALTLGQVVLPLFVRARPARRGGASRARVAVVFPTFTYLAYGNDRCALFGHNPEVLAARAISLDATDVLLSQHPEWGLSLYDTHRDGSGVSSASRWRPIPTFRPDQQSWQAGEGSGRWNYPGDTLLIEWLEREGIAWDALTDEDLHEQGAAALEPYRVVLTGNHPEYATARLIDAYRQYVDDGGRLMYLGGNGFYWKIACSAVQPGVIELRRAEDGNRSWAEEPGEYYHAFDGSYGGLWRRNGMAPQSWLGIGYSGQGFRRSAGYRRSPDSDRPEISFVFDGVREREFGERGVIGGACAGIEVDRRDVLLGADPAGFLLATSQPFDSTYLVANEELLVSRPTISAEFSTTVRADVVLQATGNAGAVFATGSIAWIGGLAAEGGDPSVQRITRNVLDRFLDPEPLPRRSESDAD